MRGPPLGNTNDGPPEESAFNASLSRETVQLAEMNEALLLGGLRQLELREVAESLNAQLLSEIAQREESEKQLRISATRFRRLFEAAQDGILIVDAATRKITDANPYISTLLEYTQEELTGKELWELGIHTGIESDHSVSRELKKSGITRHENIPLRTKRERVIQVEFMSNLYEEDGRQVIQCNLRDISDRTKSVEKLRAFEERYRVLYGSLPVAAFVCDADAVIENYNRRAVELWGREPVVGQERYCGSVKLWLPDGARLPHARSPMMEVIRTGKARRNVELLMERPDGTRLPVIVNFSALTNDEGKVTGVVTSFDDISDRKRATENLASLARRTHLLSQTAGKLLMTETAIESLAPIFGRFAQEVGAEVFFHHVAASDGTLTLVCDGGLPNRQREALETIPMGEDLCGQAATSLMPVIVSEIQTSGKEMSVRLRGLGARAYACYPLNVGPRLFGTLTFVALYRDRFSSDDLVMINTLCDLVAAAMDRKRLMKDASAARAFAEKANTAKDDFLAALSHELRTPLNPVLLLATAAAADPQLSPEIHADFEVIVKNTMLEARLIDDLLDSTMITRGKLVLDLQPLAVNEVVKDAIAHVQNDFDGKHLTLNVDLDPTNPFVRGDPMRLQQIYWNILKNAAKFTPDGGKVSISTSVDAATGKVVVHIVDTGPGMTPAELGRVFAPFTQGDHAQQGGSKKFGGLGLGLAIAGTLAVMHSGSIRALSDGPGRGSRFIIELPLLSAGTADSVGVLSNPVSVGSVPPLPLEAGVRILLVEDHAPTRIALARLLSRRKHEVSTAGSLAQARELGMTQTFDLLITDIGLPDGSGYELMEELNRLHGVKGIAMTGYGMDEDLERSAKAGFHTHLTKPVKMQTLEKAILAVIQ